MEHNKILGKLLGQGMGGEVYELTDTTVLRKSKHETDGFRAVCWLNDELRAYFDLPTIIECDQEETEWAILERLYPIDSDFFSELRDFDWDHINVMREIPCEIKNEKLRALIHTGIKLFYYVHKVGMPVRELDLGPRNIMQRKDGTLVINDPFAMLDI